MRVVAQVASRFKFVADAYEAPCSRALGLCHGVYRALGALALAQSMRRQCLRAHPRARKEPR